jgi:hypothetical protein
LPIPRYQPKPRILPRKTLIEGDGPRPKPPPGPRRRISVGAIGFLVVVGALAFVVMQTRLAYRVIETTVDIDATPARVWRVLSDTARYGDWNPFIRSVVGEFEAGKSVKVTIASPDFDAMSFEPVVLVAQPERELRWRGKFLVPGLFDGEHVFILEEFAPSKTRLHHAEKFTGLMVAFGPDSLFASTKAGFVAMNEALKSRAEAPP